MERTPQGTPVGVDDPYAHVDRCDHLTDDGTCRLAVERPGADLAFARGRAAEDYTCPVAAGEWDWPDCPKFRSRSTERTCARCGLEERRLAHDDERPLLEAHHLSYDDGRGPDGTAGRAGGDVDGTAGRAGGDADWTAGRAGGDADGEGRLDHEITVVLCRWCHAKVHQSWARLDDDVSPDPEAIAAREGRRSRELDELAFRSAAERRDD